MLMEINRNSQLMVQGVYILKPLEVMTHGRNVRPTRYITNMQDPQTPDRHFNILKSVKLN